MAYDSMGRGEIVAVSGWQWGLRALHRGDYRRQRSGEGGHLRLTALSTPERRRRQKQRVHLVRDASYVYVNIDSGWQGERDANGVLHPTSPFRGGALTINR